eukprot:1930003-Amphidinium_carterae.1
MRTGTRGAPRVSACSLLVVIRLNEVVLSKFDPHRIVLQAHMHIALISLAQHVGIPCIERVYAEIEGVDRVALKAPYGLYEYLCTRHSWRP